MCVDLWSCLHQNNTWTGSHLRLVSRDYQLVSPFPVQFWHQRRYQSPQVRVYFCNPATISCRAHFRWQSHWLACHRRGFPWSFINLLEWLTEFREVLYLHLPISVKGYFSGYKRTTPWEKGMHYSLKDRTEFSCLLVHYPAGTSFMNCLFQGGERQSRCGQERGDWKFIFAFLSAGLRCLK